MQYFRATLSDTSVELYSYTDSDVRPYQASKRGIMKDAERAFVARASGHAVHASAGLLLRIAAPPPTPTVRPLFVVLCPLAT